MNERKAKFIILTVGMVFPFIFCHAAENKYADVMAKLHPGMTISEAKKVFGKYNNRFSYRNGSQQAEGAPERASILRYALDNDHYLFLRIEWTAFVNGSVSDDNVFSSTELCSLEDLQKQIPEGTYTAIQLINQSFSPDWRCIEKFDPVGLIRVVNYLYTLGEKESLKCLQVYYDLATKHKDWAWRYDLDEQRIFLITLLLFVNKDGNPVMAQPVLGRVTPDISNYRSAWPVFPLVVTNDTPFFVLTGSLTAGATTDNALTALEYCRLNCILRTKPLTPTENPVKTCEGLFGSQKWKTTFESDDAVERYLIRLQAVRCLSEGSDTNKICSRYMISEYGWDKYVATWPTICAELCNIKVEWSKTKQCFEVMNFETKGQGPSGVDRP